MMAGSPLYASAAPGLRWTATDNHGVWRGDPSGILARLTAGIVEFQPYWDALPRGLGRDQLRHFLRTPGRFFGFQHELQLSVHLKGFGFAVEPSFFDPRAAPGQADIVASDSGRTYGVQCKARNPSVATNLTYEVFQFLAGRFGKDSKELEKTHVKISTNMMSGYRDSVVFVGKKLTKRQKDAIWDWCQHHNEECPDWVFKDKDKLL